MATNSRSVFERDGQDDNSGIATRVAQITVSAIKQMPVLASKIGGCVSLGQGIPSLSTPQFIREAVIEELRTNSAIGKYSLQPGLPELKKEIARDLERTKGLKDVDAENEIFVSCGGMESLAAAIATIVERGDEVILLSPTYASHIEQVLFAEGVPRFVPLNEEEGWKLDARALASAITKKTKAIVISNPVNPTGAVYSEEELSCLAGVVLENDLLLLLDEAYDFLIYDDYPFRSMLSMPELKNNIMSVCSFSKRYCMTGWRVGFMYAPARIIRQVLKVHDAFAICAPTVSQYAALAALRATNGIDGPGDRSIKELVTTLKQRRDLVCRRLETLSHTFSFVKPRGGYYIFPKIFSEQSSIDFSLALLNEAKVITIPGSAFGPTGEGHVRLSFGAEDDELNEAFDRLEKYFSKMVVKSKK